VNIEHLHKRYTNDAEFHAMVQCMYHSMDTLGLTPAELREAASFAAYIHESETVRRLVREAASFAAYIHESETVRRLVLLPSEQCGAGEHISQHAKERQRGHDTNCNCEICQTERSGDNIC
jgi:predicted chitinase